MPRFSIIVPAYNVGNYIDECIKSVISQKFQDYEVLLINDGSTDNTLMACSSIANKYPFIRFFSKTNEGLSETRNLGIREALGEYLYFLDADDFLDTEALNNIDYSLKCQHDPDVLITNYTRIDAVDKKEIDIDKIPEFDFEINEKVPVYKQFAECYIYGDMSIIAQRFIVKRDYVIKNNLFFMKGILHEDELWSPQIFLNARSVGYCRESCYKYRYNRVGSIMQSVDIKNLKCKIYIIDCLVELAESSVGEISKMYYSRAACILNGVLTSGINDSSGEIALEIRKRMRIFLKSVQKKYTILYILLKIFGIKNSVRIEKRFINEN